MWMEPRTVAEGGVRAVMTGRDLYVPGLVNRLLVAGLTVAPGACTSIARTLLRLIRLFRRIAGTAAISARPHA
jgi:hypothetical protein